MNINLFVQGNKTVALLYAKKVDSMNYFYISLFFMYTLLLCVIEFIGAEHCESAIEDNDARGLFIRFQSVTQTITFNVNK